MDALLSPEAGGRHFLLGNEAIVRGALEAGVVVAATYPGTPSSEIGDTFARLAAGDRYYFEYSTNEKVAMEVAYGASMAGARAMCFMKHVGINVAADAMMTLVYAGTPGGMVIVTADDPSCHSSQNEQDNRYYARLGKMPMLEPSTPDEARRMVRHAFDLSEQVRLPVFVRTTTRLSHMRGIVTFERLPDVAELKRRCTFEHQPSQMVCVPGNAKKLHPVLLEKLDDLSRIVEADRTFNVREGQGEMGIVTSGVGYNYVQDALAALGLSGSVEVARLGISHPFPNRWLADFLRNKTAILVVEELEPYLEEFVKRVAYDHDLRVRVLGKATGHFPYHHEYTVEQVTEAIAREAGTPYEAPVGRVSRFPLPQRPPTLCAGCPHRATFYAAKLVTRGRGIFHTDIGCYGLAVLPPINMADVLISMGSSINTASGISRVTDEPSIAFIGDSTFFHNGMTGLANAAHNGHRQTIVIVDNRTTGMTGHQPHPGTARDGMGNPAPALSIEAVCQALGATGVATVDPFDLRQVVGALERAVASNGLDVIVSRAPCIFVNRQEIEQRPRYQVDPAACRYCGIHDNHTGCGEAVEIETQLDRAARFVGAAAVDPLAGVFPEPLKPPVAPCVEACPVSLCVQSYITLLASGRTEEAARVIRERIPLPATVGRVCHHPCEAVCTRGAFDDPVAICALKRFAMETESRDAVREELARRLEAAPNRGREVAVIGGGPAGLACAHDLRLRGYRVTLFEASDRLGGMLTLGIPAYRLPRDLVEGEIHTIVDTLDIDVRLNTALGADVTLESLAGEGYAATFIACGAWHGMRLGVPGEDGPGVHDALAYLKRVNQGTAPALEGRIAVIGGGDAAIDAARTLRRMASGPVTILYRRTEAEMPAQPSEVAHARREGVEIAFLTAPVRVVRDAEGAVEGLEMIRMKLGEPDASGRRRPVPIEGSGYLLPVDAVVCAIGQQPDASIFPSELKRTDWGTLEVDQETGATNLPGVFAGGDSVTGPKTVIDAIAWGQVAAFGIDRYLAGDLAAPRPHRAPPPRGDRVAFEPRALPERARLSQRVEEPGGSLEGDFREVVQGFDRAEAVAEAARCLACGMCASCRICLDTLACPAFYVENGVIAIDEALCNGCGLCAMICPNGAIRPVQETLEV